MDYNINQQHYRNILLRLIVRKDYKHSKAMRFTLNNTNQNVWIPKKHLETDGTIKPGENLDYVFHKSKGQLWLSGVRTHIFSANIH